MAKNIDIKEKVGQRLMIGINGILIILMYQVYKKIRRFSFFYFLTSFLILILIFGVLYELFYFFKGSLV